MKSRAFYVGGLVGWTTGTVSATYVTGQVENSFGYAGGLVGENAGLIRTSYSRASVVNTHIGGGLVGRNQGTLLACYSNGSVNTTQYRLVVLLGVNLSTMARLRTATRLDMYMCRVTRIYLLVGFSVKIALPQTTTVFNASYWDRVRTGHNTGRRV